MDVDFLSTGTWLGHSSYYSINGGKVDLILQRAPPTHQVGRDQLPLSHKPTVSAREPLSVYD